MSIDEAIAHAREVAKQKYAEGMLCHANPNDDKLDGCIKCAEEHEQLAEWLEELKALRNEANEWRKAGYAHGYSEGYKIAIDDFVNKLKTYNNCENKVNIDVCAYSDDCRFCTYVVGKGHVCMLDDISEQLKEGGVDAVSI